MTDFRNYTLLKNISNLSGVRLSRPSVNLTFLESVNLSDKNLTSLFTAGSTFRSLWFNYSIAANASFSVAMSQDFTVVRNGVEINSSWFDQTDGRINGTANVTGKYEFFNNACNADGCVLGEFWVEEYENDAQYSISENGFASSGLLDNSHNYFHTNDGDSRIDTYSRLTSIFYHKSDLYNDGQDKVITN